MTTERGEPRRIGPYAKRLLAIKMAKDAIPDGGGFADGVRFLSSKESIVSGAKRASEWVQQAIDAVRAAAEPNEFKNADDETIAKVIVEKLDARRPGR